MLLIFYLPTRFCDNRQRGQTINPFAHPTKSNIVGVRDKAAHHQPTPLLFAEFLHPNPMQTRTEKDTD
jgi:hypothetical protein